MIAMARTALDHIDIQGFKSIADAKVELRPVNLLIGANGSGKSNFLEVFEFLNEIRQGRLQRYVAGGADRVLHFGFKTTKAIQLQLDFGSTLAYTLELVGNSSNQLFPGDQVIYSNGLLISKIFTVGGHNREAAISDFSLPNHPSVSTLQKWLASIHRYKFNDSGSGSKLGRQANIDDNRLLTPDGSNLAPCLYYLQERQPEAYAQVVRTVRLAAPFFSNFQLAPLELKPDTIKLEWTHKESSEYFDVASLSDGTLRFIALATLLLQPPARHPAIILLDEPELGLHPYAIGLLAAMIKQAAVDTQVVVATQSPTLLDHFEPDDVLVADRIEGATRFRRLNSTDLASWLEDYSLSELWHMNELGGGPIRA